MWTCNAIPSQIFAGLRAALHEHLLAPMLQATRNTKNVLTLLSDLLPSGDGNCLLIGFYVIWVFFEDDQAFQNACEGQILVCGQLSPVAHAQQHWRCVRLETRDGFGPPSLHATMPV